MSLDHGVVQSPNAYIQLIFSTFLLNAKFTPIKHMTVVFFSGTIDIPLNLFCYVRWGSMIKWTNNIQWRRLVRIGVFRVSSNNNPNLYLLFDFHRITRKFDSEYFCWLYPTLWSGWYLVWNIEIIDSWQSESESKCKKTTSCVTMSMSMSKWFVSYCVIIVIRVNPCVTIYRSYQTM